MFDIYLYFAFYVWMDGWMVGGVVGWMVLCHIIYSIYLSGSYDIRIGLKLVFCHCPALFIYIY